MRGSHCWSESSLGSGSAECRRRSRLILAPTASAYGVDPRPDFCRTGRPVATSICVEGTEFSAPQQPVDFRNVSVVKVVYTNPERRHRPPARRRAALRTLISGDPEGVHTVELTVKGLCGLLVTADGAVLLAPATSSSARSSTARSSSAGDGPRQGTSPQPRERLRPVLRRHDGRIGLNRS